jgi:hypothetical protein
LLDGLNTTIKRHSHDSQTSGKPSDHVPLEYKAGVINNMQYIMMKQDKIYKAKY